MVDFKNKLLNFAWILAALRDILAHVFEGRRICLKKLLNAIKRHFCGSFPETLLYWAFPGFVIKRLKHRLNVFKMLFKRFFWVFPGIGQKRQKVLDLIWEFSHRGVRRTLRAAARQGVKHV